MNAWRGLQMRNKNKADFALIAAFIIFLISMALKLIYKGSFAVNLLSFTVEAALIGGIADWFAVTALFRKPLGIPWHTALIPANRAKLIESLSKLVEDELLGSASIAESLKGLRPFDAAMNHAFGNTDRKKAEALLSGFLKDKLVLLNNTNVIIELEMLIKNALKTVNLHEYSARWKLHAIEGQADTELLLGILGKMSGMAGSKATRARIYKLLKSWERKEKAGRNGLKSILIQTAFSISKKSEYTNILSVSSLMQKELVDMLDEVGNPDHPLFKKLLNQLDDTIRSIDKPEGFIEMFDRWRTSILDRIVLKDFVNDLVDIIISSDLFGKRLADIISKQLMDYVERIGEKGSHMEQMNEALKTIIEKFIISEHHLIGDAVKGTLGGFTDERLISFIESKTGEDLQWIRINGTLVGGAAGALVYLFLKMLYDPFVVPALQTFFRFLT
jgi:uncharacterized membrane-anchored protein YjiN (DUF445 family)